MVSKTFRHLNLDYLNMMTEGDADMRDTMIAMLQDELPTEIARICAALDNSDWHDLREASHKMKSTLAFIGNDAMTKANTELEVLAKTGSSPERMAALVGILEGNLDDVLADLEDCLNG